jgi:alanyl-tRNA synthetase
MQQHTGQHILSAAFVERLAANTVGFHLSDDYATIDLDRAPITPEELLSVEDLANSTILENRPVHSGFVTDEDLASLPLRKAVAHEGPVRIVEVQDMDFSACGGTHVRAAGEIGVIKITSAKRRGQETRVEFLCGQRALNDYRAKHRLLAEVAAGFTVGHWEVGDLVHRLDEELRQARRDLRRLRNDLLTAQATALWHEAEQVGELRVVGAFLDGRSADDIKHLAQRLIEYPGTVALLAAGSLSGGRGFLTFARSQDLELHMGQVLRQACEAIGGRGGGRPEFAQGGSPDASQLERALDQARQIVGEAL